MRTDDEIIRDFMGDYALTTEENARVLEWAKACQGNADRCLNGCPLRRNLAHVNCLDFFTKFIATGAYRFCALKSDTANLHELANNCIKICNEIKIKTKRETPMQVVVSHSNGKTIYHCYNCGKPLFIQPSTQYCECCGQKLSFEVVENEI